MSETKLPVTPEDLTPSMRAEEVARAQASDLWTMAALITANGGASAALLSHVGHNLPAAIALSFYMAGVAAALIAGRLSANLAHHGSAIYVSLVHSAWAIRNRATTPPGATELMVSAQKLVEDTQARYEAASLEYDKAAGPGGALGVGVFAFILGCIAAGVALF